VERGALDLSEVEGSAPPSLRQRQASEI